jgi:hypothetical protein
LTAADPSYAGQISVTTKSFSVKCFFISVILRLSVGRSPVNRLYHCLYYTLFVNFVNNNSEKNLMFFAPITPYQN